MQTNAIDTPKCQQLLAGFKISERYFVYGADGVPYESDNEDLPFNEWDKCVAQTGEKP